MFRMVDKSTFTELEKCASGIEGLDQITDGGLPKGRPTLICGAAGSGKTMFAMQFLVQGALTNEPGVFISFEENEEDLIMNFTSLGVDISKLEEHKKLIIEYVFLERAEIEETGDFDLEGLFIRIKYAMEQIGAKRIVIDTIEAIFAGLPNEFILRSELRRLFNWLKNQGLTAVITGERGENSLTRYGLEEYVADCVILLDTIYTNKVATRNIKIIKYRGSSHGYNEYPFLINDHGISILPITSLELEHDAPEEFVSTGIERLDYMLDGKGYYRGSSILITGSAGTGKSSLAAIFVEAACKRGEKCLYLASEESPLQIIRNMKSISIDLEPWIKEGILKFHATRPTLYGLEAHLVNIYNMVNQFQPKIVVLDPISNLLTIGSADEVKSIMTRLLDFMKSKQMTILSTSLVNMGQIETEIGISSLMDSWIDLKAVEVNGERNRTIDILKTRGLAHSNQIREFQLTDNGIKLIDVYIGPGGMLTGSARISQIDREKSEKLALQDEIERRERELKRKNEIMEAKITELKIKYENAEHEFQKWISEEKLKEKTLEDNRKVMAQVRAADRSK